MASMDSYPKAAMERMMKLQDVILKAMAKKLTWWQAAEIVGHERAAHAALAGALRCETATTGCSTSGGASREHAGADGDGGESVGALPGEVLRSERAALPREAEGASTASS